MAARKRNPLQKLKGIVRLLAQGLTVRQACSVFSCSDEWFFGHTRAGHQYEYLRDEAEAAMVSARLREIDKIGKAAFKDGDYKTALNAATWKLEKLKMYRKQIGDDATVQLNQQFNNNFPLVDTKALEEARARLDETKRLEQARASGKSQEETRPARVIEIDSQEADYEGHYPLALEDAPEPQRAGSAGTSMRASETDPSSGQPIARPITESLSQKRQRWLQQEREQQGGDGKNPFVD